MEFNDILEGLKRRDYHPVYFFCGEEPYYIDILAGYIEQNVLTEEEKGFNQQVFYGRDTDISAVIEAARVDNPGKEVFVDDKRAYVRIHTEQEMILRQATIEEELGRPFRMNDLEVDLSSFAGQIESRDDSVRFYFNKKL